MGRHAKVRSKEGPKAPRGGDSQVRLPKDPEGGTFTWVSDRGEAKPRCRGCGTVVPISRWWRHGTEEDPCRPKDA